MATTKKQRDLGSFCWFTGIERYKKFETGDPIRRKE